MEEWKYDKTAHLNDDREIEIDNELGVHTTERRLLVQEKKSYFNYQPTAYDILKLIFEKYPFAPDDQIVDFGCGLGRVLFVAEKYGCMDSVGIEVNKEIYEDLLKNIDVYPGKEHIRTYLISADKYQIEQKANKFFFFNPFHIKYFMRVFSNIQKSQQIDNRKIYLFLYAPATIYTQFLDSSGCVELVDVIEPTSANVHPVWVYSNFGK